MATHEQDGFTLLELMVVILIIGVLVTIAIPVFNSAKTNAQRRSCFSNERVVEGAYNQYAASNGTTSTITDWPSLMTALVPSNLASEPVCPQSGHSYTFSAGAVVCVSHGNYRGAQ